MIYFMMNGRNGDGARGHVRSGVTGSAESQKYVEVVSSKKKKFVEHQALIVKNDIL